MKALNLLFMTLYCTTMLTGCSGISKDKNRKPVKEEEMEKWSDPGKPIPYPSRHKEYESNLWTRAYYYEGLMNLWKIDPQQRYLDYAVEWGNKHDWGLRNASEGWKTRNADNQCAGQTYLFLYEQNPEKPAHYIEKIKVL